MAILLPPQQCVFDEAGNRVLDARLYVYRAGTTTPVAVFQDAALKIRHPMPIPARGNGVMPIVYIAPGTYRLRFEDPYGGVYDQIDSLKIEGATGDEDDGGGTDIDATRLFQTGDIKDRYGTGSHPGWCRLNGRSIGSSVSSGSERANDDTHDLFVFLWNTDPNLAVAGGRGANAEADWTAAKTIALPDQAGRGRIGLDDLGGGNKGRLNGGLFAFGGATTLGSYGGEATHVQTSDEMAFHGHAVTATMDMQGAHTPTGSLSTDGFHSHNVQYSVDILSGGNDTSATIAVGASGSNASTDGSGAHSHTVTMASVPGHVHAITASATTTGISKAMNWLQPFLLVSNYIKL